MSSSPARKPQPHFPAVHLRPPRNWLNDPNGVVHHDGHHHVFFQYNPGSARHADMHWGHFRSTDLVNWELLPIALAPTPGGDDAQGVWSGNAVESGGELVAFYSARHAERWYQPVAGAVSRDGGLTFTKYEDLLVADPPDGTTMFRDPYVWRDGDRWRMLVGAALADGRGAAVQYDSADLKEWTYRGVFLARAAEPLPGGADTEEGWECAQYAPFGHGRGAVLASAWDPEEGAQATVAWPGREEDGAFTAGAPQRLDHGPDFYAPAIAPTPDGRWLMWAWIWEARDEERVGAPSEWTDEAGWAGMLSLPRELTLAEDGTPYGAVRQRPARELDRLRRELRVDASGEVSGDASGESSEGASGADLGEIGRACDLTVRLAPGAGLRVVTSPDGTEYLDLTHDRASGEVIVSRDHASLDSRAKGGSWRLPIAEGAGAAEPPADPTPEAAPIPEADAQPVADLRIVLDHSVAEVFTAAGEALTIRFYPVGEGPWLLRATGDGAAPTAYTVQAWDLAPLEIQDKRPEPELAS